MSQVTFEEVVSVEQWQGATSYGAQLVPSENMA